MLVNMNSKLRKLQWKYDYFTKGTTMDLDEVLTQTLEDVRSAEAKITALEKSRDDLRLRLKSCVQNLRVLRYNAFDNTGSDLSYSVALVDEENNGVVLSKHLWQRRKSLLCQTGYSWKIPVCTFQRRTGSIAAKVIKQTKKSIVLNGL